MQIVSNGDNLVEMSNPVFWKNNNNKKKNKKNNNNNNNKKTKKQTNKQTQKQQNNESFALQRVPVLSNNDKVYIQTLYRGYSNVWSEYDFYFIEWCFVWWR